MLRALVHVKGSGGRLDLTYTWSVAGHHIVDERGAIQLPKLEKGDVIEVSVMRSDGVGEPVVAKTQIANRRPKLLELSLDLKETREHGEVWKVESWGTDPDGDALEYEYTWMINGKRHKNLGDSFPAGELERGDTISVRVVATDGESDSEVGQTGTAEVANTAPDFVSSPPPLDRSGVYRYEAKAEDSDGDRGLKFELVEGPDGMEVEPLSGLVTWKPTPEQAGRHNIEIAVQDKHDGRTTQSWVLPVVAITEYDESPAATP